MKDTDTCAKLSIEKLTFSDGNVWFLPHCGVAQFEVEKVQNSRLGLCADMATDGREAVEMFRMLPYDLILMDCQMPEMDGYSASREIRRKEWADHRALIVAMTADAMAGVRARCLDAGMDEYITKPVKLENLREILRRLLKGSIEDRKSSVKQAQLSCNA